MDIAQLGYEVDSSGLEKGNRALDEAAAKSEKVASATARLEVDYARMAKSVEDGTRQVRDGIGGMAGGIQSMVGELQSINRGQTEYVGIATQMHDLLARIEGKLGGVATGLGRQATESERAAAALQQQAAAAAQVEAAQASQESRLRGVAQRGVEYAEAMRTANVSERALAEAAREAALGIDVKAQTMAAAGSEQERMVARAQALQQAEARLANETAAAAKATQLQELGLSRLLGQIDPTIGKLNQLAQLEGTLEKALDLGAITPEVFDQYQGKIDQTRAAILKAGQANDVMERSLGGLNLRAVETQQSLAALVRAIATGQWGQAQSSITSLTARTGVMSSAFTATGTAVGSASAAFGGYLYALHQSEKDTSRVTNALLMTGNYAGVTAGQIDRLVDSMASLEGVTHGGARDALVRVAESGRIAGQQFEMVAAIAARMEAATGQSLDTTIGKFEEIGRSPVDALLRLNEAEHFLTEEHLRRIDALIAEGDEQGAAAEAARIYAGRLDEVATAAAAARPHLSQMMTEMRGLASAALEGAKNFAEFLAATARLTQQRPLAQQFGIAGAFNFMRDMYRAEPTTSGAGTPLVAGAVDSRKETERRAAAEAAERDIQRQIESMYGLDTAVNRLERSFGALTTERQQAMIADGRYTQLLAKAVEEDEKRAAAGQKRTRVAKERISDEERAEQKLQQQYAQTEAGLARQIALHGQVGRAAAMAYDTAHGALTGLSATQKSTLMEMSQWLDWLDEMAALQGVWDEITADHRKAMDANQAQTDAMTEYARQAARNTQSHFANFLFDPFAEGTRNMGKAFSDTLRRMAAEAASAKLFEMIGGAMSAYSGAGSGWINAIGGVLQGQDKTGREYGGAVYRGDRHKVGERNKPELLTTPNGQYLIPGDNGRVDPIRAVPAGRGGAMGTPQINISLIGAPEGTTATAKQNGSGGFDMEVILGMVDRGLASRVSMGASQTGAAMKNRYGVREAV